tara:strand:- start:1483 stop:2322 length:840 start_codon:yes stop_codon:yes gene_type:complete
VSIDQTKKSNRLLGNRRFTSDALSTSQESFTNVLDINANEVYTQAKFIPTGSLPFSGSSQQQSTYTSGSNDVLKYYYRQKLTKSNVANDVFFFMFPTGSDSGVTPQLVQDGQQGSFISPKYSVSSLANANTEDTTPGYGVKVFKSTSLNSGSLGNESIVSANDYQFDYKTGILQFETALASNQYVYMTANQYVGKTLQTDTSIGGGGGGTSVTANPGVSGSGQLNTITIGGSSFAIGSGAQLDNFFEQDGNGDVMPTNQNDAIGIFYEYDDNNDLQPVA